jgi:hypothetical protein
MDKTVELLDEISQIAHNIGHRANIVTENLGLSEAAYNRLSGEHNFVEQEDVGYTIETAAEFMQDAHNDLAELDKQLMRLIYLRGKLADRVGVPIGARQWVRLETYDM